MKEPLLPDFDGIEMDGLEFCFRVYRVFEKIRALSDGRSRLRMRQRREKKLLEELMPICRYVQTSYRAGRYISIKWVDGSQGFDAEVTQHGGLVDQEFYPRHSYIEVTGVNHPNEHLMRELLDTKGFAFNVEGISKVKGEIISVPVVLGYLEHVDRFLPYLRESLSRKLAKVYPSQTVLIVECSLNTLYMPNEWEHLMTGFSQGLQVAPFSEIFVSDGVGQWSKSFFAPSNSGTP